ncbi:MAG: response regulator [Anaerolineales bacterium]|nr:response regulator [Anaerolineales bacterium]
MEDTQTRPVDATFVHAVRDALTYLYDWVKLRRSHLVGVFDLGHRDDPGVALREVLIAAIEYAKPGPEVPTKARAWRYYNLLYARYIEQFTQGETAIELGLSIRHLRREEVLAVEAIATRLWNYYEVENKWLAPPRTPAEKASEPPEISAQVPNRIEELAWMQHSFPSEPVDVQHLVQEVVSATSSATSASHIRVECHVETGLPRAIVQRTALRQALLTLLTVAARLLQRNPITIRISCSGPNVCLDLVGELAHEGASLTEQDSEQLGMARELLRLSRGGLEVDYALAGQESFSARVVILAERRVCVLVVDDNWDTLQLLERYLSGTSYQFVGTTNSDQAFHLLQETPPDLIVLDVMFPEVDGWELLGRLRQHPLTQNTPIIICTILPHEQLALDLGATAFVRKPFTREQLLTALDQYSGQTAIAPD